MKAQMARSTPVFAPLFRCVEHAEADVIREVWLEPTGISHAGVAETEEREILRCSVCQEVLAIDREAV